MKKSKRQKKTLDISRIESIKKNDLSFQIKYFENNCSYADKLHYSEISTNEDFLSKIIEVVVIDRENNMQQTISKRSSIRLINLLTYHNSKNEKHYIN